MIATQAMVGVERDGYVLFMANASTLTVMPEVQAKLPLDLDRDLVAIGLIAEQPMMIAVHPSLGINSLAELVERGRSRPNDLLTGASRDHSAHGLGDVSQQDWDGWHVRSLSEHYPSDPGRAWRHIERHHREPGFDRTGVSVRDVETPRGCRLEEAVQLPGRSHVAEALPEIGQFEASGWVVLMAPAGVPDAVMRSSRLTCNRARKQRRAAAARSPWGPTCGSFPRRRQPRLLNPSGTCGVLSSSRSDPLNSLKSRVTWLGLVDRMRA